MVEFDFSLVLRMEYLYYIFISISRQKKIYFRYTGRIILKVLSVHNSNYYLSQAFASLTPLSEIIFNDLSVELFRLF